MLACFLYAYCSIQVVFIVNDNVTTLQQRDGSPTFVGRQSDNLADDLHDLYDLYYLYDLYDLYGIYQV